MSMHQEFTLTDEHIKLLRRVNVSWEDTEAGAPAIDPKRPYGNSDVPADMHEILAGERPGDDGLTPEQITGYSLLHCATKPALQIVLSVGEFVPGVYVSDDYGLRWRKKP